MSTVTRILIFVAALSLSACSGNHKQQGNSAESQKQSARQAQDELSRETSR